MTSHATRRANLKPVGTGPYKFVDFKPGDIVRGEINTNYHIENRPHFDTIEFKGGGDAVSAARAVIQTGEFDFAWNMQVEDEILQRLEKGGKGKALITASGNIEHIQLNNTDPWTEVDGERASAKTKHPLLTDKAVRQALGLLVDRGSVEQHIYGRTGVATGKLPQQPGARALEEHEVGVQHRQGERGPGSRRLEEGSGRHSRQGRQEAEVRLPDLGQYAAAEDPGDRQAGRQKAGIDMELKSVTASVFFSSDVANPDTYSHFYCDMQMYTTTMTQPDAGTFMNQFTTAEIATKENKWQGRNITRWSNAEYDKLHKDSDGELDPVKRSAMFIRMNDLVCGDNNVIPVVYRPRVAAIHGKLKADISGWDTDMGNLKEWYREA